MSPPVDSAACDRIRIAMATAARGPLSEREPRISPGARTTGVDRFRGGADLFRRPGSRRGEGWRLVRRPRHGGGHRHWRDDHPQFDGLAGDEADAGPRLLWRRSRVFEAKPVI